MVLKPWQELVNSCVMRLKDYDMSGQVMGCVNSGHASCHSLFLVISLTYSKLTHEITSRKLLAIKKYDACNGQLVSLKGTKNRIELSLRLWTEMEMQVKIWTYLFFVVALQIYVGHTLIFRPNYGIILEEKGTLDLSNSEYSLTFLIQDIYIDDSWEVPDLCRNAKPLLGQKIDFCDEFMPVFKLLQARREQMMQDLRENNVRIDTLLPRSIKLKEKRGSWFPGLTHLLSSLSGLANADDLEQLQQVVRHMYSSYNKSQDKLVHFKEELSSYLQASSDRVGEAIESIRQNAQGITNITAEILQAKSYK